VWVAALTSHVKDFLKDFVKDLPSHHGMSVSPSASCHQA